MTSIDEIRERLDSWVRARPRDIEAAAHLIANAPDDLAWCLGEIERLQKTLAQAWQEGFYAAHDQHVAFEDRHSLAQGIAMHNPYTSKEN